LYHIELSAWIEAPASRVWRALCDPREVVEWDTSVITALDPPSDYPQPGQHVRWRCRGILFRVLHDRPQEAIENTKLRSILDIGPTRIDETYLLNPGDGACRLDLSLDLTVRRLPFSCLVEQLYAGPEARRGFETALAGLKRHCERTGPT
jgi:hypothetical protein